MSAPLNPMLSSFNGGEISRRLMSRTDLSLYAIAVASMENFVPTVEGPAVKRPGFVHIRAAATTASWVTRFRFNITQSYVLEWSAGKLRFFTNGGRIETAPNVAYELTVPYSAAEAKDVWPQQSFDVQYLAHRNHPPAELRRTSATTFSHSALTLREGPFGDQNIDESITITASGTSGSVTLTASSAIFQAGHVGSLFQIEAKDFSDIPAWEAGIDSNTSGSTKRRSDGKVYVAASSGRTGTIQPIHDSGTEWDGSSAGQDINAKGPYGVQWTYLHDRYGIAQITAIGGGGTTATATVIRQLPDSLTTVASHRWAHSAFSAVAGWPSIVIFWQNRLWFIKDFEVVASVAGDLRNFRQFTSSGLVAADVAIRRTIAAEDPIRWARISGRELLVGSASTFYAIRPINNAEAISGENIEIVEQAEYGSDGTQPIKIGSKVIFAQRGSRKLREADYSFESDRYVPENINIFARHILKSGVKQICFQQEPEQLLWAVRNDGVLACRAHSPEQDVKGWSRVILADGGLVRSATTVPSDDGSRDELWILVERAGVKSVERMHTFWDEDSDTLASAVFVDSAVTYAGVPISTISSGLSHLAGKSVRILADGAVVPEMTVTGGGGLPSPLPKAASVIAIGLGYSAKVTTLRLDQRTAGGQTIQGRQKRVNHLTMRLIDTAGLMARAVGTALNNLINRPASAPMDAPIPLFNGMTDRFPIGGGYNRDGQVEWVSDDNLPCIIEAALPELEVSI